MSSNIWMTVHSSRMVDLRDVRSQDVSMSDIAHSLSQICRFNGHTTRFYSVAAHCMGMAQYAANKKLPTDVVLKCLLHDAKEAYYGDITTPVSEFLHINWNIWAEGPGTVGRAIAAVFFQDEEAVIETPLVKRIDHLFTAVEGYTFIGGPYWEEVKVSGTLTPEALDDWNVVSAIVRSFDSANMSDIKCRYLARLQLLHSQYLREQYLANRPAMEVVDAEDSAESPSPAQG